MDEDSDPPAVDDPGPEPSGPRGPDPGRPPLADRALSEPFARLRYRDTSLTIWQQQQQQQQTAPPSTYLMRSRSAWYSSYGNQAVLVRDHRGLEDRGDQAGRSRICSVM
ncbi:putative uncharacterized protein BRD3OS [Scophthalmus maximus]|nr:putative uncharacterized protein BRD3OS [Scophthalmus maximus]